MKFALFAAAALLASPALAQTGSGTTATPGTAPTTAQPGADGMAQPGMGQPGMGQPGMGQAGSPDAMAQTPQTDPAMSQQAPMPGTAPTGGNMTAGGYQPSQPMPMAGADGQRPVFTPGPSVAQAYPAPAPLASYPVCKKGQYDKCIQRGGR